MNCLAVVCRDTCMHFEQGNARTGSTRVFGVAENDGSHIKPMPMSGVKIKCLQVLPLRRLMMLGCDDGQVRVCGHVLPSDAVS